MRLKIFPLVLLVCALAAAAPGLHAAKKNRAAGTPENDGGLAIDCGLASAGFRELFVLRNREIEAAEPGRFFPGTVAFALGRIDESGHYLKLSCGGAGDCPARLDMLEERLVHATLLEVIRTPGVGKQALYSERTWALTELGEKYIARIRKRYPDLNRRLARLVGSSFGGR